MSVIFLRGTNGKKIKGADGLPLYVESSLKTPKRISKVGALVRDSLPGREQGLFRDTFKKSIVNPSDWPALIKAGHGDHRRYINWIYNQKQVGSCASEGLHGCVDVQRERRGMEKIKFNPYPIYYYASGGRDIGSSLTACIREAKSRGMVPDKLWPRSQHRWNDLPPESVWKESKRYRPGEVYDLGNHVEAASALFLGHSVYAAYPGHAWELVTVLNSTQAMWRNSWGSTWDGDGIGVISFSRITFQYGLFAVQSVSDS